MSAELLEGFHARPQAERGMPPLIPLTGVEKIVHDGEGRVSAPCAAST